MRGRVAAALVLAVSLSGTAAMAQDSGTAKGALKLGDQVVALTHAYAREDAEIPEMLSEGEPAKRLVIVLADRELSAGADESAVLQPDGAGDLHALIVRLDPASGSVLSGNVILGAGQMAQFFSQTAGASFFPTQDFKVSDGRVSARVSTAEPQQVMSLDGGNGQTYGFDVAFSAVVMPAPALVAAVEGDAARDSEPAQAFGHFLDAVVASDAAAAQAGVAAAHPGRAMLTPDGLPQVKDMLLSGAPDAASFLAGLAKVYVYERRAALVFKAGTGVTIMHMVKEDGAWKLGG